MIKTSNSDNFDFQFNPKMNRSLVFDLRPRSRMDRTPRRRTFSPWPGR